MPPLPPEALEELRDLLLRAALPSFAAAAVVLALFALPGKSWCAALGGALALPAGLAAAKYFRPETFPWRPEEPGPAWQWLPAAALAALALGLVARLPRLPASVGFLLRAAACAGAAWLVLPADLWTERSWLQPAFILVLLAEWQVLEAAAERAPGGAVPLGLALVFLGGSAVLIHAHSARFAEMALMVAAALVGIAVVAWWKRTAAAAVVPGVAVLLPGLLLSGHAETFSDVPWTSFALLGLAPLALVLTLVPPVSWLGGVPLRLVQLALLLAPVGVAVALAMQAETLEFARHDSTAGSAIHAGTSDVAPPPLGAARPARPRLHT
jgi:CDP-diglyceride synthetase